MAWWVGRNVLRYEGWVGQDWRRRVFETYHPYFIADRAALAANPFFVGIGNKRDAGEFLNERNGWSSERWEPFELASLDGAEPLVLPADVHAAFAGGRIFDAEVDLIAHDPSWLSKLHAYDHWALDEAMAARAKPDDEMWSPMPGFTDFTTWAKVRLLAGWRENDMVSASADVQQLARLLVSTETLIGTMVASGVLLNERRMHDDLVAAGFAVPAEWQPMTYDDYWRIRRVARSSFSYVNPGTPSQYQDILDGTAPLDCLAIHEGVASAWATGALGRSTYPSGYCALDRLVEETRGVCRFSVYRKKWLTKEAPPDPLHGCDESTADADACMRTRLALYIPGYRDIAVQALDKADTEAFTGLHVYGEDPPR